VLETVEADIERLKSSWTPSFQVTSGVPASTQVEQSDEPESQESIVVPVALSNDLVLGETLDESQLAAPALEMGQSLDNRSQIEHLPQVS
jgi:hypothetical protein